MSFKNARGVECSRMSVNLLYNPEDYERTGALLSCLSGPFEHDWSFDQVKQRIECSFDRHLDKLTEMGREAIFVVSATQSNLSPADLKQSIKHKSYLDNFKQAKPTHWLSDIKDAAKAWNQPMPTNELGIYVSLFASDHDQAKAYLSDAVNSGGKNNIPSVLLDLILQYGMPVRVSYDPGYSSDDDYY